MERQHGTRRPLPRRGQVLAAILASLFGCLLPEKEIDRKEGKLKEGGGSGGCNGGRRVVPRG
ncbi:hypothetical protein ABZP36_005851 [Zizania latifolia]